jgi:hypothetical protein
VVLKGETTGAGGGSGLRRAARLVWRELLLPLGVTVALLMLAVALIEGPPLEQFLYAVF